jgi:hypothetical protein
MNFMYGHMNVSMHVCIYVNMHLFMCVYTMYMHMFVRLKILYQYTCVSMCAHVQDIEGTPYTYVCNNHVRMHTCIHAYTRWFLTKSMYPTDSAAPAHTQYMCTQA